MSDDKKPVVIDLLMVDTIAGHHWLSPEGKAVPKPKPTLAERLQALGFRLVEPTGTGFVIGTGGKPKRER
jgi:hypothetical protein